jgi:hypothetical protein
MLTRDRQPIALFLIVLVLAASIVGCTSSYTVSAKSDSLAYSYQEANQKLQGRNATIAFVGGQTIEASNVSLASDSIRFDYARGTLSAHVLTSQVLKLGVRDGGQGTIDGLGIGMLAGSITGLAILLGARAGEPSVWDAPALGYAFLGGGGALLGGGFGALAGSSIGHSDEFIINTEGSRSPITKVPVPQDSSYMRAYVSSLDIGSSFSGSDFEGGWRSSYAIRAGFGRVLTKTLNLYGYLDYYKFHLPPASGNSALIPQSAHREDVAIYASVSLVRVIVLGAGLYYTTSDPVKLVSPFDNYRPYAWGGSGFSGVRFFTIFGLSYDIHFTEAFFMPVGLYYRTTYDMNSFPVIGRMGLGITF